MSITFTLKIEPDLIPVRGNAMASGDDAADRACEDEIIARLNRGDVWAWCVVTVSAHLDDFTGIAILGGCSYQDEADFKACGSYQDLVREAVDDLKADLEAAVTLGATAAETLRTYRQKVLS